VRFFLLSLTLLLGAQPTVPVQPLGCAGGITVLLEGQPFSSGCVLNIKAGPGIIVTPSVNSVIGGTDLSFTYNTTVLATHDNIHTNEIFCNSQNGAIAYTCNLPYKAITNYLTGMYFMLLVDQTCLTSCTLNINGLGPKSIKKSDGSSDPQGTLIAGQAKLIWYDGIVIRLMF
jgi:hypothetical protein